MASRVRKAGFDFLLDLHGNSRSRLLALFSGTPTLRIRNYAFARRLRVWMPSLTRKMPPHVSDRSVRAAAQALGLAEYSGSAPTLSCDAEELAWADRFLSEAGLKPGERLIAIAPGAAWATKRWSEGYFAQALGLLAGPGRRFIFIGGPDEEAIAKRILEFSRKGSDSAILATGKTDSGQLKALIARSSALLCNDSGPMHVADALAVPVLALFGPTIEDFGFFPRGEKSKVMQKNLSCRPCAVHGSRACPIGTHECMTALAPFDVVHNLEAMLAPA
jgi:heptosyltransferase-2